MIMKSCVCVAVLIRWSSGYYLEVRDDHEKLRMCGCVNTLEQWVLLGSER